MPKPKTAPLENAEGLSLSGSSRTEVVWAPWVFLASQLSQRLGPTSPKRLTELLTQGPSELKVTLKEALLLFPSSRSSPRRQRREGAGQAREEQWQCRPSASQEQEGLDICGGSVGKEKGQQAALITGPRQPSPTHSAQRGSGRCSGHPVGSVQHR